MLWPAGYPAPEARGAFVLVSGDRVERGATLGTPDAGSATVVLGGDCRVNMEAATALRIEGAERQESVFLKKGGWSAMWTAAWAALRCGSSGGRSRSRAPDFPSGWCNPKEKET